MLIEILRCKMARQVDDDKNKLFQMNDWVEIVNRYSNVIRHPGQNEGKEVKYAFPRSIMFKHSLGTFLNCAGFSFWW